MSMLIKLLTAMTLPLLVGGLSGFATAGGVQTWYPTLVKPPFNPPAWVFGPVWTVLYLMMGFAAFLVWHKGEDQGLVRLGLALFVAQLALNGLWSVIFFGMRLPGYAFAEILLLWIAIAATMVSFWRTIPAAGLLLMPYLAWVSFATVLNGSIWFLNR
jgi:tryptophan-rich sensory protein